MTQDQVTTQELKSLTIAAVRRCLTVMDGVEKLPANVTVGTRAEVLVKASEALRNLMACEPLAEVVTRVLSETSSMFTEPPRR